MIDLGRRAQNRGSSVQGNMCPQRRTLPFSGTRTILSFPLDTPIGRNVGCDSSTRKISRLNILFLFTWRADGAQRTGRSNIDKGNTSLLLGVVFVRGKCTPYLSFRIAAVSLISISQSAWFLHILLTPFLPMAKTVP